MTEAVDVEFIQLTVCDAYGDVRRINESEVSSHTNHQGARLIDVNGDQLMKRLLSVDIHRRKRVIRIGVPIEFHVEGST